MKVSTIDGFVDVLTVFIVCQFPTKQQQEEHQRATVVGGAKGFIGGLAVALPASYWANKYWAPYKHWPVSLRTFAAVTLIVPSFIVGAERAGQAYERSQWYAPTDCPCRQT